jgi:tRNA-dihydrouridine synthase 3
MRIGLHHPSPEIDLTGSSDMFLGPAHKNFKFEPKHKSNSYEIEAEG